MGWFKRKPSLLRPFDASDWDGFSGAERPSKSEEPLIGESGNYIVVVDAKGIEVDEVNFDGDDDDRTWLLAIKWPMGKIVAEHMLRSGVNPEMLKALDFQEV